LEAPGGEIESVKKLVKREMEGEVFELNVPLLVEVGVGRNCAMPGKLKTRLAFANLVRRIHSRRNSRILTS
jgi:hypothetical protein